jgi:hypothetical protein
MERQAKALADRLTADPAVPDEQRLRRAFLLLFGRPPRDAELALGREFLAGEGDVAANGPTRWQQYTQALLGTNEFLYVD